MEINQWEAKSIESELDRIRSKYLMSPSDFEKSSSLKHMNINQTGTFKPDGMSSEANTQSLDKYGNEVREFVIEHPPVNLQTRSSYSLSVTCSNNFNTHENNEKENNDYNNKIYTKYLPQYQKGPQIIVHHDLESEPDKLERIQHKRALSKVPSTELSKTRLEKQHTRHGASTNSLLDGLYNRSKDKCTHCAKYSDLDRETELQNKKSRFDHERYSQSRNKSRSPFFHSVNSLDSGGICRKSHKSGNSSIERERIMYESQPNSRLNSRNRSSVVRSKIEPLRKSPILINVKKLDQLNPHSFSVNQDVFKENAFKNNMYNNGMRSAINMPLAPHIESYLDKKLHETNETPEIEKESLHTDENQEEHEKLDITDDAALTNHQKRIKCISTNAKLEAKKKMKRFKRSTVCSNSRISINSKRSKSKHSKKRRSCSRNNNSTNRSNKKLKKNPKKCIPLVKRSDRKPRLPPKTTSSKMRPKLKKLTTTPHSSNFRETPCGSEFQETLKECTDSKFLEVIDNLRELRRKNYLSTENQVSASSKTSRSIKTEIEFETSVVELINAYNKCMGSLKAYN
ncbi:unnamed protein product [Moneuplotes crassus]|uniref:Uncharacterized protein n=1 Tax=Euplotes crassus TaxID=5936 RepID=A0AAD1U5Y2_EUPCR|nr:unnamed protein product [Moneuplotes crassus]